MTVPFEVISTFSTSSPNRKVTAWSRRWNFSDSTTSGSQNSSICGRFSTTVTRVPSAENMDAYSMPMTPAPTTTMEPGTCCMPSTPSESMTWLPSNSIWAGRAGLVPVAMTMFSAVTVLWSPRVSPSTATVCSSRNRAVPPRMSTWLRSSWLRITSTSRPTTCAVRASRSAMVISDLTR